MEPQPSGVHLLLPHVPFATLQNSVAGVSLPTMPQACGDPGSPTPPSIDESPKRQVPPKGHAPAMGTAWTRLLRQRRSQSPSAGCTEPLGVSSIPLPGRWWTWRQEKERSSMESRALPEHPPRRAGHAAHPLGKGSSLLYSGEGGTSAITGTAGC